jgi:hypothetical protein
MNREERGNGRRGEREMGGRREGNFSRIFRTSRESNHESLITIYK